MNEQEKRVADLLWSWIYACVEQEGFLHLNETINSYLNFLQAVEIRIRLEQPTAKPL